MLTGESQPRLLHGLLHVVVLATAAVLRLGWTPIGRRWRSV
jgi:hypothetical protein